MTYLPDVNVWLALASPRHSHTAVCIHWLNSVASEQLAFCRVTQMGLLRLLTNKSVMGSDLFSSNSAWRIYRKSLEDSRIHFAHEPFALEFTWHRLTSQDRPATKLWTDAYLAAFANAAGMRMVTMDRAILSMSPDALVLQ